MIRLPTPIVVAVGVVISMSACGSDTSSTSDDTAGPTIAASTSIWADVAGNVACDGLAEVLTIVPPGGDPHAFEASLKDRETLENASLIVANGLGLEEGLEDMIDSVESDGVTVVRLGDAVDTIAPGDVGHDSDTSDPDADSDPDHDHDHDQDQDQDQDGDPHIWFDPVRVAATLPAIADGLGAAGVDRDALEVCVTRYAEVLATLDAEIEAILEPLAPERRLLVTNHDSLSYFADRYDFEILGSVIPSPSSLAGTNPGDLEKLANRIEESGVPAIFAETQHSSSDTEALAERVGDVDVVTLQTDTLGEPGTDTDSYVGWLTTTAEQISDALS